LAGSSRSGAGSAPCMVDEAVVRPSITTGILHRSAGTGQVGAGAAHAPLECFEEALSQLDRSLG